VEKPRYRITFDLTLAKPNLHALSLIHSLIERKFADGEDVVGFTVVDIRELLKKHEPYKES
jgi:hypothetical protein